MTALILTPDFPPVAGGIQLLVHRLALNLRSDRVTVVTLGHPGAREHDSREPLDVIRVGMRGGRLHKLAVARLNAVGAVRARRESPDVVISAHAVTAPGALAGATRTTSVVQYVHADEIRQRPRLLGHAVQRADVVVAVSAHARSIALAAGADASRVRVIHPGVDPVDPISVEAAARPTIVTVARLHERYKGHDQMIRALPLVRSRVPDVEWVVIGDGPLRPGLEAMAEAYGVQGAVRFVGSTSDAERNRWLARAQLFAMPSRIPSGGLGGEGFGIAYLEAAARGLPVVAGRNGGATDAVVDGETGRLVEAGDHVALADILAELLVDRSEASRLGEAGAKRAAAFTWDRHASQLESAVAELGPRRR